MRRGSGGFGAFSAEAAVREGGEAAAVSMSFLMIRPPGPEPFIPESSTFSVSNLGMFGIEHFTAIINPPEAGILAIGGVEPKPVVIDGEVVVRQRMRVTMSCDHRVIDGATGSKFLLAVKRLFENPLLLVI